MMNEQRFAALTARVYKLEQHLTRIEALLDGRQAPVSVPTEFAVATEAEEYAGIPDIPDGTKFESPTGKRPAAHGAFDETNLATRALLFAGIALLFIGAAYAVEFAFANGWISPQARILLGLIAGGALTAAMQRIRSGPYVYAAEGGIALGTGLMYLALWAAASVYHFISSPIAADAMAAITLLLAALAYVRKSERIAIFGAVAGLCTPYFTAGTASDTVGTAASLLILDAVLLTLAYAARYRSLPWFLLAGVCAYAPQFADAEWSSQAQRAFVLDCATIALYAEFAAFFVAAAWRAVKDAAYKMHVRAALAGFLAATGAAAGAFVVIHENDRTAICLRLLIFAALILAAACRRGEARIVRATFAGTAVTLVTLALPSFFSGGGLTDAFTIEAACVAYAALRIRQPRLATAAFCALAFTLRGEAAPAGRVFLIHAAFAHRALWLAAAIFSLRMTAPLFISHSQRTGLRIAWLLVHATVLNFVNAEFAVYTTHDASEFGISLFATAYAAAALFWGMRTGSRFWQRSALALFAVTILKVLFNDLAFVSLGLRIVLLAIVGGCCIAASLFYQRRKLQD